MAKRRIRPSEADRVLACNASLCAPEVEMDSVSEAATMGTAIHEAMAEYIASGGVVDTTVSTRMATKYGVSADDVSLAVYQLAAMLEKLPMGGALLRGFHEHPLECDEVVGTADLCLVVPGTDGPSRISIVDYKTGHSGDEHPTQLKAYAYAAMKVHGRPANGVVYTAEIHSATGDVFERPFDVDALDAFGAEAARALERFENGKALYSVGPQCKWCKLRMECGARRLWVDDAVKWLDKTNDMTPESILGLWNAANEVKRKLSSYQAVVKDLLSMGDIDTPKLSATVKKRKRVDIDPRRGWSVFKRMGLSDADIGGVLAVKKQELEKAVTKAAGRGHGKEAIVQLMAALDEAKALTTTEFEVVEVKVKK